MSNYTDTELIVNSVYSIFEKRDVRGIMLTGSYLTSAYNNDSDIDIVVLSRLACRQTTAEVRQNQTRIHYIIFPQYKLLDLIYDDILKGKFVFYSMFDKGKILVDKDNYFLFVKKIIRDYKPSLPDHILVNLLHNIDEDISYLKKNCDSLSIALNICIRTQQIIVGFLAPQSRYIDKMMKSFPMQRLKINKALSDFVKNGDVLAFSKSIKKVLTNFCTIPLEYSSSDTLLCTPMSGRFMIFIPKVKLQDSSVQYIYRSFVRKFPLINIFAYYIGNCNVQSCGSYIGIMESPYPEEKIVTFINSIKAKDGFNITPQLYSPYNSIFFYLNMFGDKKFEGRVYDIWKKCSSWVFKPENPDISLNGIEISYLLTLYLFRQLGKQIKEFLFNAYMIYLPDAINLNGRAQHLELAGRYKELFRFLNVSFNRDKDILYSSLKLFFRGGAYEYALRQCEKISAEIMTISLESETLPYNSFYFVKKEHSIIFNLYNQVLSTFSLDTFQKITICYNCSNIDLDVLF